MKKIVFVIAILCLTSCAHMKPLTESDLMPSDKDARTQAIELYDQAIKCWDREWGWFGDGVEVDSRINFRGIIIEARRYAPDIGLGREPFAEIVVNSKGNNSVVQVIESGFNPVSPKVSIIPEVWQWVLGNLSCITDK